MNEQAQLWRVDVSSLRASRNLSCVRRWLQRLLPWTLWLRRPWVRVQVGQFQVYDRRAMASLARAAEQADHPEWGRGPPPGVGGRNDSPQDTPFFTWDGGWQTPHGDFFLSWYADSLHTHARMVLEVAVAAFFPFMGASSHRVLQERGAAAIAGLPVEPPVQRNISEAAMYSMSDLARASGDRGVDAHVCGGEQCTLAASLADGPRSAHTTLPSSALRTFGMLSDPSFIELLHSGAITPDREASGLAAGDPRAASASLRLASVVAGTPPLMSAIAHNTGCAQSEEAERAEGNGDGTNRCAGSAAPLNNRSSNSLHSLVGARAPRVPLQLSVKIAGVHWWYHTPSHAAELTAGYYNTSARNGYASLAVLCADYAADIILTCVEMADAQHPPSAACGPQALLKQVRMAANLCGLRIAGAPAVHRACLACPWQRHASGVSVSTSCGCIAACTYRRGHI